MPLLECRCKGCGKSFEYLSLSSSDGPACPGCGGHEVRRLLSAFAVSGGRESAGESCATDQAGCGGDPSSCMRCGPGAFADA